MIAIMSGAITNTPDLGAAQQAYFDIHRIGDSTMAMRYAVAYPLAVVGSIMLVRYIFKVNLQTEEEKLSETNSHTSTVELLSLLVSNLAIFGKTIKDLAPLLHNLELIVSRILQDLIEIASSHTHNT